MQIPKTVNVLGFTRNPDAMRRTCREVERLGLEAKPFWNFPTAWTKFIQKRLPFANNAMRYHEGFFNSGWGHYAILSIARDLGELPVFVVEDDCRFLKDADAVLRGIEGAPDDADLLLLDSFGPVKSQDDFIAEREKAVGGWAPFTSARSAAAYIVGPRLVDRLVSLGECGAKAMKARIFDQWFEKRWLPDAKLYCAVPNLAVQQTDKTGNAERASSASNYEKYLAIGVDFGAYAPW